MAVASSTGAAAGAAFLPAARGAGLRPIRRLALQVHLPGGPRLWRQRHQRQPAPHLDHHRAVRRMQLREAPPSRRCGGAGAVHQSFAVPVHAVPVHPAPAAGQGPAVPAARQAGGAARPGLAALCHPAAAAAASAGGSRPASTAISSGGSQTSAQQSQQRGEPGRQPAGAVDPRCGGAARP
uniref:Uncharacterized protein n=1 Tax=Macrostomum lignano TaxID=282301 RepID=A0A1I8F417_9PLAT